MSTVVDDDQTAGPGARGGSVTVGRSAVTRPAGRRRTGVPWLAGRRADLAAAVVYLGLGLLVMGRYLGDVNGHLSAHLPGDHTWFEWLLSHGAYSVRHLENPLFSVRQNVPTGVNMMANTSVLGVTIPLAPLTMVWGPKVSYVVWMVGASAATATTTYWALSRHLVRSRAAAFVGGVLGGFAPGVVHHANGQPNFVSNFLLPVIVVRVLRLGATGRPRRDGLVLGLLVAYQVFINEEMLLVTAAACGVAVLTLAWQRRAAARRRWREFLQALAVTAGTAVALCGYPLWFQFSGPQTYRGLAAFHSWGEDVATYVTLPRDTIGGSPTAETTVGVIEQNTWFGWPLVSVALILVVMLWRRSVATRVAGVVALVFAVAALGPVIRFNGRLTHLPGPWSVVPDRLPVLGLLMPSRLSFAVVGVVVVLIAVGWDELARHDWPAATEHPDVTLLSRLMIAAALIPLIPTPVPAMTVDRPPQFVTSGAWRPYVAGGGTLVPVPLPDAGAGRGALGWSAAALHEFAVPHGYFLGPDTHGNGQMGPAVESVSARLFAQAARTGVAPVVTPELRAAVRDDIRRWQGSVVVLGRHPAEGVLRPLVEDLLGPGQRALDVWVWDVRGL